MIYKLQRKFILISALSVFLVIALVFGIILTLNIASTNKNMDILADSISSGGGNFPISNGAPNPNGFPPTNDRNFNFINPETPFSTRHFTVIFDEFGNVKAVKTEAIYSISKEEAINLAKEVLNNDNERGWISNYRYKIFNSTNGYGIVFVDGSMNRAILMQSSTILGIVLLICGAIVLLLIIFFSKRAVKPIADSYEKQKQFVTDANHELKTPLTLILTNLDIAESELGKNEWLDDIRDESNRMTELVNQLVALSRMDEDAHSLNVSSFDFGNMVYETASEFEALANERNKEVIINIDDDITCKGDHDLLKRLVGILMDNAIKYCDTNGEITVTLKKRKNIILTVENTYAAIDEIELDRVFDRFYRADKARTFTGGYGIGLSIAQSIAEKHKGNISAYKKDNNTIGFKVIIKT